MLSSISPDQVRAEIQRFWQIMCGNSPDKLEDLYSPSALVVTGKARKPEPANLALARRARQTGKDSFAELGAVEVQIEGPDVAIASYTYKFHQTRPGESGGLQKRHTLFGRATQIFKLEPGGALRIVHEHLSAATNPEVEKAHGA
ncbi:MAG TPA: nuclear transport factor 2 family protein [Candidatus Angelobacter sp.]